MGRIVDLADAIAYGNLEETKLDGQMFEGLLDAAEEFVEKFCGRRFSPDPALASDGTDTLTPITKTFAISPGQTVVRVPDLRAITSVALGQSVLARADGYGSAGGYRLDSYDDPATRIYIVAGASAVGFTGAYADNVAVTGRWGFLEPPMPIQQAVKALTMRMYRERDAAWADSVATPDGSVLSYFRQLPSSIQGLLSMYRSGPKIALV